MTDAVTQPLYAAPPGTTSANNELIEALEWLLPRVDAHGFGCSAEFTKCTCAGWNERWMAIRALLTRVKGGE